MMCIIFEFACLIVVSSKFLGNDACIVPKTPRHVVPLLVSNTSLEYNCSSGSNLTAGSLTLNCINDTWNGDIPECTSITCSPPAVGLNIQTNATNSSADGSYGDVVEFQCTAGHSDLSGRSWGYAVCSSNGHWMITNFIMVFSCYRGKSFVGCFDFQPETYVHAENVTHHLACLNTCKSHMTRFTALTNKLCICFNDISNTTNQLPDMQCDYKCPVTYEYGNRQCGGQGNETIIFTTVGTKICIYDDNITMTESFNVSSEVKTSCSQRCLGNGSYYSLLNVNDSLCRCVPDNYIPTARVLSAGCITTNQTQRYAFMENLAFVHPLASQCTELYEDYKIKDNGLYILKDQSQPTMCYFKDGTVCEDGWIGYQGSCYLFVTDLKQFNESQSFCADRDANLVSIGDTTEQRFLKSSIKGFPDFKTSAEILWYIGFIDLEASNTFSWTDGSLHFYTFMKEGLYTDQSRCSAMAAQHSGRWQMVDCESRLNFICERSNETTQCMMIRNAESSLVSYSHQLMSLSLCIQVCKGQNTSYAVVREDKCFCNNTLTAVDSLPLSMCFRSCPGNTFQFCGGNETDVYSIKNVKHFLSASTCEDLELQGISGISAQIGDGFVFCNSSECPYSWVKINSTCFKFVATQTSFNDAFTWCARHGGHLAVPNTVEENKILLSTITDVPYLKEKSEYVIGLKGTSGFTGVYRTSSGEMLPLYETMNEKNDYVLVTNNGSWTVSNFENTKLSFICEKSQVFKGCVEMVNQSAIKVAGHDADMTIEICIELCSIEGYPYALLQPSSCECALTLIHPPLPLGTCDNSCKGSIGQVCGSSSEPVASAYDVGEFQVYEDCDALFAAGFRKSKLYNTTSGITYCNFYDNSTNCTTDWISYNGNCFQIHYGSANELLEQCREHNTLPVSILSSHLHDFLIYYISGTQRSAVKGLLIGLEDTWEMDSSIWPDGKYSNYKDPINSDVENQISLYNTFNYITNYTKYTPEKAHDTDAAQAVMCQYMNTEAMGCFQYPVGYSTHLVSLSMELMQCRHLCMGMMYHYVAMDNDECFCIDEAEYTNLNNASNDLCNSSCFAHHQKCGGDGYVSVYKIDYNDLPFSCDNLTNAGVYYRANYLLQGSNNVTIQECGFTDDTYCKPGWLGHHGMCYKFILPEVSTDQCLTQNAYLATPSSANHTSFLLDIMNNLRVFTKHDHFMIFPSNRFFNNKFLSGDGHIIRNTVWDINDYSHVLISQLNKTSGKWNQLNTTAVSICERSPEFLGCYQDGIIMSPDNEFSMSSPTSTQCIQLCLGLSSAIAGVQDSRCFCFSRNSTHFTTVKDSSVQCESCQKYPGQACGGKSTQSVALFDLVRYAEDILESCDELFSYGVIESGLYKIQPPGFNFSIITTCFDPDDSLKKIPKYVYDVTSSSHLSGRSANESFITAFPITPSDAWVPRFDDHQSFIQFTFQSDFIITGIATQGRLSLDREHWVTEYSLQYLDEDGNMKNWDTQYGEKIPGNYDRASIVVHYLFSPVVTTQLKVVPTNWTQRAGMRIALYGQSFRNFSHNSTFLGYYVDPDNHFTTTNLTHDNTNDTTCRLHCRGERAPFYFIRNTTCFCGDILEKYGHLNMRNMTQDILQVHRTYDMFCSPPQFVNNSVMEYDFPHSSHLYSVSSTVIYHCNIGYAFTDGSLSKQITCQYNNTWSQVLENCYVVECVLDAIPESTIVNSTSALFNSTMTVDCNIGHVQPDGSSTKYLQCTRDGSWNDSISNCTLRSCGQPGPFLNGIISGNKYTFNETLLFTCAPHTHLQRDVYNLTSTCAETGMWSPSLPSKCEVFECPDPPPLEHGLVQRINITFTKYTCKTFFYMSTGNTAEFLSCNLNMTWTSPSFNCQLNDSLVSEKQADFNGLGQYMRVSPNDELPTEHTCKSVFDCADSCLRNYDCVAYNYMNMYNSCKLFSSLSATHELVSKTGWKYFELIQTYYE